MSDRQPRRSLRRLSGNLTGATGFNGDKVLAWYIEDPVRWAYRSNEELNETIDYITNAYAGLAGRDIHRRISSAEYPVRDWARALDLDTPEPVNWEAWKTYLGDTQQVLFDQPMAEPVCFFGVEVGRRSWLQRALSVRKDREKVREAVARHFAEDLTKVSTALSGIAMPATQLEMEWLLERSEGLCLPAPFVPPAAGGEPLDEQALAGIFDRIDVDPGHRAFGRSLRIVGAPGRNGPDPIDRHVVILSVGRIEDQHCPEQVGPWLSRLLTYKGVELSIRGRIQTGEEAAAEVGKKLDRLIDQHRQLAERGLHVPLNTARSIAHATQVQDVMQNAWATDAVTFKGQVRVAIDGATAEEALERADLLTKFMREQRIDLRIVRTQQGVHREFVPGEGLATTEFTRHMPVRMFATGVPQASPTIGDRRGLRIGWVVGGGPFTWDMFWGPEHDRSGVTPISGEQGCGKSFLMCGLAGLSIMRGVHTTAIDPPGTMAAALSQWGPIKEHVAVLDVMSTEFTPYAVFPEPRTADFYGHPDVVALEAEGKERDANYRAWELAQDAEKVARHERYQLTLDCLRSVLPHDLGADGETELHLSEAIYAHNECKAGSSIPGVLRELRAYAKRENNRNAQRLADQLERISDLPQARNWMRAGPQGSKLIDARGLIMKTDGLRMPHNSDPAMWETAERLGVPLLALAVHFGAARMYRLPRHVRKLFILDEAHYLKLWASMRALLAKMERESRKLDIRGLIGSQDPDTTLLAQEASEALIYDAIIGQTSSPEHQAKAARLLHLDPVFQSELGRLRRANEKGEKRRDFLMRVNGEVGRVRVTFDEVPDLVELMQTTPTQGTGRGLVLDKQDGWFR